MYKVVLIMLLASLPLAGYAEKNPETMLLGEWCGKPKHAYHQTFVLESTASKKEFRSYMHQKPAEFGTWALKGKNLSVKTNSQYQYKVLMLSLKKLVLLNQQNEKEYYFRCSE
jgi:hypothetical protein